MPNRKIPLTAGEMLRKELEKKKLSQRAIAKKLGGSWTAPKVSDIVSEKRGLSVRSALDLEKALNIPAEEWLKCQMKRKLWEERKKRQDRIA